MNSKNKEVYNGVEHIISKRSNGRMIKKDWIILAVLLAFVCIFSFINFATTKTPQTGVVTSSENEYVIVEIPSGSSVGEIYFYASVSELDSNDITIYSSTSLSESYWISKKSFTFVNADMYSWELMFDMEGKSTYQYVVFKFKDAGTAINEIVLTDATSGNVINVAVVESSVTNAEQLYDESSYFSGTTTNTNSMYFDEIYFARTAYEILNDMPIYETSHPHLGKLLIAVGVSIFGMNPFGYRIVGLLFSILSVALMYLFGKKVFKSTIFASVMGIFFACDGLRFVQGRIGTVDSFLVFFIILAFYFMYSFFEKGMDVNSIKRSLLPFCISGIFFGLAVSVKWNGLYAGVGLCILFILVVIRTFKSRASFMEKSTSEGDRRIYQKRFIKSLIMMFVSGVTFFVVIPLATYFTVFAVTYQGTDSLIPAFIQTQINMFGYHSGVTSVHSSASSFWTWPLNAKGVYMYFGDSNYSSDMYARIQSMTITAIAVYGVWAIVYFVQKFLEYNKKKKANALTSSEIAYFNHIKTPVIFFTVGLVSNWLPWMFVSRSTFLYHFYPAMPFYIGLIATYLYSKVLLLRKVHYKGEMVILGGNRGSITVGENFLLWAMVICLVNFILFFPVFSGIPIAKLPATFMFGWANGFWGHGLFPY